MRIWDIKTVQSTWIPEDILYGLKRVDEVILSGRQLIYDVYLKQEAAADRDKEDVKLFYFPAASEKYIILAAGGAYIR